MQEVIIPRFEFRVFGQQFTKQVSLMNEIAKPEQIRNINEIYFLTEPNTDNNVKIRNKKMDIKNLLQIKDGYEQWNPYIIGDFPLSANILKNEFFPALGIQTPAFDRETYTLEQFINEIIETDPDIHVVFTQKKRTGYTINGCICEIVDVWVNNAYIQSIAIEAENTKQVEDTKKMLGLDDNIENVSYPKAIKRIIGLEKWPQLENLYK